MKFASHLLLLLVCTTSVFCNTPNRTFDQVIQEAKQAAPAFIDWGISQMHKYPAVPGILTAAILSKAKENIMQKRSSFVVWGIVGAVMFAEPYRLFAQEYLSQRNAPKNDKAVVLAAQKGSQEVVEKISEKIEEFSNNSK